MASTPVRVFLGNKICGNTGDLSPYAGPFTGDDRDLSPVKVLLPDLFSNRTGFFCACHGSKFDLAGRVFKGVPAPTNLEVPPHKYLSDTKILIGVDTEATS